jgi:hypothetical protein
MQGKRAEALLKAKSNGLTLEDCLLDLIYEADPIVSKAIEVPVEEMTTVEPEPKTDPNHGWPSSDPMAEILSQCINRKLMRIRLSDNRVALLWKGRHELRVFSKVPVTIKEVIGTTDAYYEVTPS